VSDVVSRSPSAFQALEDPARPTQVLEAAPAVLHRRRWFTVFPPALWGVALLAALLHMMPVWHAAWQTPTGWTFTGNTRVSPDFMQYRVWIRESQHTGVLVRNNFTPEANRPHLPVFLYYAIGRVSGWTGIGPELVMAYLGAALAAIFSLLLFAIVRQFFASSHQVWWVFLAILFGGGLGAHLRIMTGIGVIADNFIVQRTIVDGLRSWISTWEDLRTPYPVISLFDTHIVLVWILTSAAVASLYFTFRRPCWKWTLVTAALYSAITLLHVYESITLLCITAGVVLMYYAKGLRLQQKLIAPVVATIATVSSLAVLWTLHQRGGLPMTSWRADHILFASLVIAHPLAWMVIAKYLGEYWRRADETDIFLLGWMLGCVALTLSAPFYPWTDRGTMTLAIPVYVIAGRMYFAHRPRIGAMAALLVIAVMGLTPVWMIQKRWKTTGFDSAKPFMFLSGAHEQVLGALRDRAQPEDLLLADERDLLWIAPEYPGRHYCAHFFLTVDYKQKQADVAAFFAGNAQEQASFLREKDIRYVFVGAQRDPIRFSAVPGLRMVTATRVGSLFEFGGGDRARRARQGRRAVSEEPGV
jgi:hypothetical protein